MEELDNNQPPPWGTKFVQVNLNTLEMNKDFNLPWWLTGYPPQPLINYIDPQWIIDQGFPEAIGYAYWPEVYLEQELQDFQSFDQEILTANLQTKRVEVTYTIRDWSAEEIETEVLKRIETFKTQIYSFVRPKLDAFVNTRRYENLNDAISYLNSNYQSIKFEAERALELRDAYRLVMFAIIKDVEDRTIPIPTQEQIEELNWPPLLWEVGDPIEPEIPREFK